ncbi:MAG: cation:proton antiporter [Anaerolineales bacterium]|nr:cation:proton antiporter [Anaerolineales bacterium]MCB0012580.1 cation:proton antiporter [Anaerolineales bacterium]MCB0018561.1 cation:proton antiporter [Anaerolineales bacterium]MCB0027849.1 cation:proton antiporter [Anaerolineales bacterium]
MTILTYSVIFLLIALAAKKIGGWFSNLGLPYITGYLLTGIVAGPFVLKLLPTEATSALRYIDELSLGIIAFVAGSELYLKEIRSRLRSIGWISGGVLLFGLVIGGVAIFLLTELIPFTSGMDTTSRLAVAILGGTILLALSPASTIAVIKEVRAKGNFTRTILGVTVTMDVIIIVVFAVSVAIASAMLEGLGFNLTFIGLLLVDLGAAIGFGYLVGKALDLVLGSSLRRRTKMGLILLLGYAVFVAGYGVIELSHNFLPFEIHIEPLLVAMIGGFMVTNYTRHRDEFEALLHEISPLVYVAFFTLTGLAIKLDILLATWPIALALFAARILSIFIGSYLGSKMAGEPGLFQRHAWLGLITQAGIALGLAREVAVEFPDLGDAFATMVISVVVLNEIFGPMFCKLALRRVNEANLPEPVDRQEVRDAVILGIEEQSLALARQLQAHQWQVIMADTDRTHVERLDMADISEHHIPTVDETTLAGLLNAQTDALVAMLPDDEDNFRACELAVEKFGVNRLIVRPNDMSWAARFSELGALIVDPASAMVYLLDQSVRAPQSTSILLHQDSGREILQITVSNPDVDGLLLRDLRLPDDVLFLDVTRAGQAIVPTGYTRIRLRDEVTLVGRQGSLADVTLKLGY